MSNDPLGITEQMRERGRQQAELDAIKEAGQRLLAQIADGLARLDGLPDGTMIRCGCCGLDIPVEAVR